MCNTSKLQPNLALLVIPGVHPPKKWMFVGDTILSNVQELLEKSLAISLRNGKNICWQVLSFATEQTLLDAFLVDTQFCVHLSICHVLCHGPCQWPPVIVSDLPRRRSSSIYPLLHHVVKHPHVLLPAFSHGPPWVRNTWERGSRRKHKGWCCPFSMIVVTLKINFNYKKPAVYCNYFCIKPEI